MKRTQEAGRINPGQLLVKAATALTLPTTATMWEDLVSVLGSSLNVDWILLVELPVARNTVAHTLAAWHRGKIVPSFDYAFERLPEDDALTRDICLYSNTAQKELPNAWLKQVQAKAFGRASLFDSLGRLRGLLVIAHSQPLQDADGVEAVLRIFAFRAATELERALADEHFYHELLEDARVSRPR
jgi:two-component system, sensor histidine kinase and response regulator